MVRKAVVVGASSGIGAELARILSADGYELGLAARRVELLEELHKVLPGPSVVRRIDVTQGAQAMAALQDLLAEMGDVELIVLNSGVGYNNPKLKWEHEQSTIETNVTGFAALANVAFRYFEGRPGFGHLVAISSVAGARGGPIAPAYSASKAFMSTYLEALRLLAIKRRLPIDVTDIRPGYVDTPMTKGQKGMFWVIPAARAASLIGDAIRRRSRVAYIPARWRLVYWVLRLLPEWILRRVV